MSELTRDEKIYFIMKAVGVAECDFAAAKKQNYDPLSDTELDERYQRILKGSNFFEEWRRNHSVATEQPMTVRDLLEPL